LFQAWSLAFREATPNSVYLAGRYAPRFQAFSWLKPAPLKWRRLVPPQHRYPQGKLQAVETIEKVTFQKLFLKSATDTLKISGFCSSAQHFGIFSACCGRFL
jgi:hypothetical protein